MRILKFKLLVVALVAVFLNPVYAAVGCDLNDPDRDVRRLFPDSTGYKTEYLSIDKLGGEAMLKTIEKKLGDNFKGVYETIDVPYTLYEIFKGGEKIGYIHGINQKGKYGGIQVFLALGLDVKIKAFYIQKLTSREAAKLRSASFARQFEGLSLNDFNNYDVQSGVFKNSKNMIENPAKGSDVDFKAILRAVKKNLIITEEFIRENTGAGKKE